MGAHLLSWTLWLGSSLAQEPPPQTQLWADRIKANYGHYQDIGFQFLPHAPAAPPCPSAATRPPPEGAPGVDPDLRARLLRDPAEVTRACEELRFSSWMLRADLTPEDQRVFAAGWLRVVELPEGVDAVDRVRRMAADGAIASRNIHVVAPAGGYLVDLHLPCGATGLARYEIADLLSALAVEPAYAVPVVAVSPCGRTWFSLEDAAELRARGAEPSESFGMDFPESRDRARRGGVRPGPGEELPD